MSERVVKANGIELWTEDFGNPSDPPLLLVMGASAQGIAWPEEFCQRLVEGGRYVIRYDNRDTGLSTCFDFATQPYALRDLADDAVGLLDAYELASAHFAGASMGGMIGQEVAIRHPSRIRTLTSIMSSPAGGDVSRAVAGEQVEADLPGPDPALLEVMLETAASPPTTRSERIAARVKMFRALAGSLRNGEDGLLDELMALEVDRARNFDAMNNHGLALQNEADRRPALRKLDLPTLVIHGTEDPILPYEHGVATAEAIPGAELLTIEGMGHDLPEVVWPRITDAILKLTQGR